MLTVLHHFSVVAAQGEVTFNHKIFPNLRSKGQFNSIQISCVNVVSKHNTYLKVLFIGR